MTFDKLISDWIGKSVAEQEAMSDVELMEYWKPVLDVTRPDRANKNRTTSVASQSVKRKQPQSLQDKVGSGKFEKLKHIAEQLGLNIDEL